VAEESVKEEEERQKLLQRLRVIEELQSKIDALRCKKR
jgi:hypothetical protein